MGAGSNWKDREELLKAEKPKGPRSVSTADAGTSGSLTTRECNRMFTTIVLHVDIEELPVVTYSILSFRYFKAS